MTTPIHMSFESTNIESRNISAIEKLFPSCITEVLDEEKSTKEKKVYKRAVDFEKLKTLLGGDVAEGDEAYEFTWVGKKAAIVEANKPIRKTLRPCKEESKNWDTTQNLYIEGDNLDVLKMLQESYLGKVKMIYIDPPYNTGNDFIYRDDFKMSCDEYDEESGVYDDDGNRMFKNTDTNGRFHSDWCSMIYPRLALARNLLTDDGVIFISIDDNEQNNLKKICDEVFGEENFVATFPWRKRTAKSDVPFGVSQDYEWIICYGKSNKFKALIEGGTRKYFETEDFPNRPWRTHDLTKQTTASERPNSYFTIVNPKTGEEFPANQNATWRITKETFTDYYETNRIVFPGDYDFLKITKPVLRYWKEDDEKKAGDDFGYIAATTKLSDNVGMSQDGTKEITSLLGNKSFSYPKPSSLIKHFVKIATSNLSLSTDNSPIILDFFSGSATTAHAVMQLNAEDGGNRKFIMVQLPEVCDEKSEAFKAGYKNICEIGKERIRRAGEKLVESYKLRVKSEEEKLNGKLSRTDCLEEGNGSNQGSLFDCKETSEGGDVCSVGSDEKSSGINSVEHSRGTGKKLSEGVCSISQNSSGVTSGVGNTTSDCCASKVFDRTGYSNSDEYANGNSKDDKRTSSSTQNSQLVTNNSELTTRNFPLDIGFRVFKADSTNMTDVYYSADEYDQGMLSKLESNVKPDRTDLDLLFSCLLEWGLPLSMPYKSEMIEKCTVHTYNDGDLIACFDENVPDSVVKKIAKRKPLRAVFRDSSFADSPSKINVTEIFKLLAPDTRVKVI